MLKLIACVGENRELGRNGQLIWHIPADMKRFRAETLGKIVIMGRKTFESIGKPLASRRNLVLSRGDFHAEGVEVFHDKASVLRAVGKQPAYVIGGAQIYRQFLPDADEIILTIVPQSCDTADTFFPTFDRTGFRVFVEYDAEHDLQIVRFVRQRLTI